MGPSVLLNQASLVFGRLFDIHPSLAGKCVAGAGCLPITLDSYTLLKGLIVQISYLT